MQHYYFRVGKLQLHGKIQLQGCQSKEVSPYHSNIKEFTLACSQRKYKFQISCGHIYPAILYSYFSTRLDVNFAQVAQLCCLILPKTKTAFHGRSFSTIEPLEVDQPIVLLHGLFKIRIKNV